MTNSHKVRCKNPQTEYEQIKFISIQRMIHHDQLWFILRMQLCFCLKIKQYNVPNQESKKDESQDLIN